MPNDKFGRVIDENWPYPDMTQRMPVIRPDGSAQMAPTNQGAGAGYAPVDLNAGVIKPKPRTGASGGGFSSLLSSLLGGGMSNQPVGMPTPVDPPASIGAGGSLAPAGGAERRGVSPALSGVLTGSGVAQGGGDAPSTIQQLLAQLLKRDGNQRSVY